MGCDQEDHRSRNKLVGSKTSMEKKIERKQMALREEKKEEKLRD